MNGQLLTVAVAHGEALQSDASAPDEALAPGVYKAGDVRVETRPGCLEKRLPQWFEDCLGPRSA